MTDCKHILDVTCGTKSIWFDKRNESTVFCDARREDIMVKWSNRKPMVYAVDPDVVCDFTDIPFPDCSFELVVFDPPHVKKLNDSSWMKKRYGDLSAYDDWGGVLRAGFDECMRVLKPYGTLIFKWSDVDIPTREVLNAIGCEPLFGHRSGRKMNTHWMTFMKGVSQKK